MLGNARDLSSTSAFLPNTILFLQKITSACLSVVQVQMCHKVLSSDMSKLVEAMRLAHKYCNTSVEQEFRKSMLQAAHMLALNARNLLSAFHAAQRASSACRSSNPWRKLCSRTKKSTLYINSLIPKATHTERNNIFAFILIRLQLKFCHVKK